MEAPAWDFSHGEVPAQSGPQYQPCVQFLWSGGDSVSHIWRLCETGAAVSSPDTAAAGAGG